MHAHQITLSPREPLTFSAHKNSNVMELVPEGYSFGGGIYMARRHDGPCIPYWVCSEARKDQTGRKWNSGNIYCVQDDFGVLVEVPYKTPAAHE